MLFMIQMLPYFDKISLSGPEARSFLERIITSDTQRLATQAELPGALLTPQGKVIADFILTGEDERHVLHVHHSISETLFKRLKLLRLRADVAIELHSAITSPPIDHKARIMGGLAAFGHDYGSAEIFPTDINLDRRGGLSFSKGCFVGQEVASRMKRRGKIRKRTLVLNAANMKAGLEAGLGIHAGEKKIGQVTSACENVALGLIRTDHLRAARQMGEAIHCAGHEIGIDIPDWLEAEMETMA